MANTTNFGWETPDDTDLVKDGAAAIRTLGSAIDTSLVDLKGGTTGQVLSKASNTDMDFTWSSVDPLTILDAKGDLISATAADTPARLAVGTNGQVLTANSSTSTGLEWTTLSSGGMTLISETVASGASSISFSSISSSYKQLILVWSGIRHSASGSKFVVRFNNDSSNLYDTIGLNRAIGTFYVGNATLSFAGGYSAQEIAPFGINTDNAYVGTDATGYLMIDNYSSSTKFKNYFQQFGYYNTVDNAYDFVDSPGIYRSTSAITSLDIVRKSGTGTISNTADTSIRLYGVA